MTHIRECLDTGEEFDISLLLQENPPLAMEFVDENWRTESLTDPESLTNVSSPRRGSLGEHIGIHSMAEVLVRFLESLPEPVLPFHLYDQALSANHKLAAHEVCIHIYACINETGANK